MKKPHRQAVAQTAPPDSLAGQGLEASRRGKFREAIELLKQALRTEARPEWRTALADAYRGRARDLAAKTMFKEASMVLENTIAPDGSVRDPALYLDCLIRDGQRQKAAAYLLGHPPETGSDLEALAAALLVTVPRLPDPVPGASPEQVRWREHAAASRAALAAWCDGGPMEEIDRHLNAISLRSAFRPLRLLLKGLITTPPDTERTRRILETIPPASPFFPLGQAVVASTLRDNALDADAWNRLTSGQQAFVAETAGVTAAASQGLARLTEAERGGPAVLFNFLTRQTDLPRPEVRQACLNLLPRIPDHIARFEKSFGTLKPVERRRVNALAAEARDDWESAGRYWHATADAFAGSGEDREARLAQGVIYRYLARLAPRHPEIDDTDSADHPVIAYLRRARAADPDHLPGLLALIHTYRHEPDMAKDWHQLVDETARRFPDDARVLQEALDSALARKAYKQASGFARALLKINSINPGVRRQMIELQLSYARKQMRAKRPDLALKALPEAAEWERADTPSAPLRIVQGLVERRAAATEGTEAKIREGVALAGGGVAGWFRARLEAELMKSTGEVAWLSKELTHACETPPTTDAILAIGSALGLAEAEGTKGLATTLLLFIRPWLRRGAGLDWKPDAFQAVMDMFTRFRTFDLLGDYAQAARRRNPADLAARFHQIVARAKGNAERISMFDAQELVSLSGEAQMREDVQLANRIARFMDGGDSRSRRRRGRADEKDDLDDLEDLSDEEMQMLFSSLMDSMPKETGVILRQRVKDLGREQAVTELIGQLKSSPFGPGLPERALRELCGAMVDQAMEGGSSRRGGARQKKGAFW